MSLVFYKDTLAVAYNAHAKQTKGQKILTDYSNSNT